MSIELLRPIRWSFRVERMKKEIIASLSKGGLGNRKDGSETINFVFNVRIISGSFYHFYSFDTVHP